MGRRHRYWRASGHIETDLKNRRIRALQLARSPPVDQRYRGQGWGRYLLADALRRCIGSEIAGFAVIVAAIDDDARRFYERESFLSFPDTPNRLFRPHRDIVALIREIDRGT